MLQRRVGKFRPAFGRGWALVAVAALLVMAGTASAQDPGLTVGVAGLTPDDWPAPQAVVTVLGEDGRPVAGLTVADFTAQLNGEPLVVDDVAQAVDSSIPIDVVLALDVSGSMAGGSLDEAKISARSFLRTLAPEDMVAVIAFNDTVVVVQPFTNDKAEAAAAIDGLTAGGETALYQATADSVRVASESGSGRQAVVLLSDGLDHGSVLSSQDALAATEASGVPVFTIGLGADIDQAYLQAVADTSGGRFAATPSPEGLALVYADVAERLRGQYILTLDASALDVNRSLAATLRVEATVGAATSSAERSVCPQRLCLTLVELVQEDPLSVSQTFLAKVIATDAVAAVTFSVDGVIAVEIVEPPYEFTFDPALFPEGEHAIIVEASSLDETASQEITVGTAIGGGGLPIGMIGLGLAAAVAIAAVLLVLIRRQGDGDSDELPNLQPKRPSASPASETQPSIYLTDDDEEEAAPIATSNAPLGHLVITGGSLAGESFPVSEAPLTIGSGSRCQISLPEDGDGSDVGVEHTRVWVRQGALMVHELRRLSEDGAAGGSWEILSPGEEFSIGSNRIRFDLIGVETGEGAEPDAEIPNILRDRSADPASGDETADAPTFGKMPDGGTGPVLGEARAGGDTLPVAGEAASEAPSLGQLDAGPDGAPGASRTPMTPEVSQGWPGGQPHSSNTDPEE